MNTIYSTSCLSRRGHSIVSLLVVMACLVVLFVILMTALQGVMGGGEGGRGRENTVRNHADRMNLAGIHQGMATFAASNNGRLPVPSEIYPSLNKTADTTAALFSLMLSDGYVVAKQLVSDQEQSPFVNYYTGDARGLRGVTMPGQAPNLDIGFRADLHSESHVSYAHMPLLGRRLQENWVLGGPSNFPLLGNRGPAQGQPSPDSYACDPTTGEWAGNVLFADGHVEFSRSVHLTSRSVGGQADNIFALEDDYTGSDAFLTFVLRIDVNGFEFQHD